MPNCYSSKYIVKVLQKNNFEFISQKGSHQKFKKPGDPNLMVIVPANKKAIPYGTFRAILLQSELSEYDFKK
ncbi:type II toxin-antitoxin system HicA family toxin [Candidatus Peregrinibacteria bacterium]|jgi:predicted RNA binding protein YcfA (HicA-like mRNA interferase family)|nr:type II toxin-antitoxin system HicA family toxin [Candidatus Peregrinibacteria bacterium]